MASSTGSFFLEDLGVARGYPQLPEKTYKLDENDLLDKSVFAKALTAARLARAKEAVSEELIPGKDGLLGLGLFRRLADERNGVGEAVAEQTHLAEREKEPMEEAGFSRMEEDREAEADLKAQKAAQRKAEEAERLWVIKERRERLLQEHAAWKANIEALAKELEVAEDSAKAKEEETEAQSQKLERLKADKHQLVLELKRAIQREEEEKQQAAVLCLAGAPAPPSAVHSMDQAPPLRSAEPEPEEGEMMVGSSEIRLAVQASQPAEGTFAGRPGSANSGRRRPSRWSDAPETISRSELSPPRPRQYSDTVPDQTASEHSRGAPQAPSWQRWRDQDRSRSTSGPYPPSSPPRRYPSYEEREAMRAAQRAQRETGSPGRNHDRRDSSSRFGSRSSYPPRGSFFHERDGRRDSHR